MNKSRIVIVNEDYTAPPVETGFTSAAAENKRTVFDRIRNPMSDKIKQTNNFNEKINATLDKIDADRYYGDSETEYMFNVSKTAILESPCDFYIDPSTKTLLRIVPHDTKSKTLNINIPEGIENINKNAFDGIQAYYDLTFPSTVTEIPNGMFFENKNITSITCTEGIERIGRQAFCSCENLQSATMPKSLKVIEDSAFSNCKNLKTVKLQDGIEKIEDYAFNTTPKLSNITLPDSIKSIGKKCFCDSGIKTVKLPKSLEHMGESCFEYCRNLHTVVIPDNQTSTNNGLFDNGNEQHGLKCIESRTFAECYSLAHITIGQGVRTICDDAFYDSGNKGKNGMTISLTDSTCNINKNAFAHAKIHTINIPKTIAVYNTNIPEINFADNITDSNVKIVDGTHFNKTTIDNVTYNGIQKSSEQIVVINGTNNISTLVCRKDPHLFAERYMPTNPYNSGELAVIDENGFAKTLSQSEFHKEMNNENTRIKGLYAISTNPKELQNIITNFNNNPRSELRNSYMSQNLYKTKKMIDSMTDFDKIRNCPILDLPNSSEFSKTVNDNSINMTDLQTFENLHISRQPDGTLSYNAFIDNPQNGTYMDIEAKDVQSPYLKAMLHYGVPMDTPYSYTSEFAKTQEPFLLIETADGLVEKTDIPETHFDIFEQPDIIAIKMPDNITKLDSYQRACGYYEYKTIQPEFPKLRYVELNENTEVATSGFFETAENLQVVIIPENINIDKRIFPNNDKIKFYTRTDDGRILGDEVHNAKTDKKTFITQPSPERNNALMEHLYQKINSGISHNCGYNSDPNMEITKQESETDCPTLNITHKNELDEITAVTVKIDTDNKLYIRKKTADGDKKIPNISKTDALPEELKSLLVNTTAEIQTQRNESVSKMVKNNAMAYHAEHGTDNIIHNNNSPLLEKN